MFLTTAALLTEGPIITLEAGSISVLTGLSSWFNLWLLYAISVLC